MKFLPICRRCFHIILPASAAQEGARTPAEAWSSLQKMSLINVENWWCILLVCCYYFYTIVFSTFNFSVQFICVPDELYSVLPYVFRWRCLSSCCIAHSVFSMALTLNVVCVCVCVYARAHILASSCLAVSPIITIILSFFSFEISYCKDVPLRSLMRTTNQLYHPLDIYAMFRRLPCHRLSVFYNVCLPCAGYLAARSYYSCCHLVAVGCSER